MANPSPTRQPRAAQINRTNMARTNKTACKSAIGKAPRKQLATNVSAEESCAHQTVEPQSSRHELEQAANIGLPESDPDEEADDSSDHPAPTGRDSNPSEREHSPFTFQFAAPSPDTPYTTPKKVNKRAARRSAPKPVLLKFDAAPIKVSFSPNTLFLMLPLTPVVLLTDRICNSFRG